MIQNHISIEIPEWLAEEFGSFLENQIECYTTDESPFELPMSVTDREQRVLILYEVLRRVKYLTGGDYMLDTVIARSITAIYEELDEQVRMFDLFVSSDGLCSIWVVPKDGVYISYSSDMLFTLRCGKARSTLPFGQGIQPGQGDDAERFKSFIIYLYHHLIRNNLIPNPNHWTLDRVLGKI